MRTFKLVRTADTSGISGVGDVAEGVEFHDKKIVLSWLGKLDTLEILPNIETVVAIHGHSGSTTVVWDDTHIESAMS